jgi:hypothetical protein
MFFRSSLLISTLILSLCCCTWQGTVKGIFEILTVSETVSAEDFFTDMYHEPEPVPSQIKNFQGMRIDLPGFTSYYLRYDSNEWFVLNMVNSMPSYQSAELESDSRCEVTGEYAAEKFSLNYTDELSKQSFWQPEQIKEKEYYTCFKFPWRHTILFDKRSGTVYHVIEEIGE